MTNTYTDPASKLLKLGRPKGPAWLDYAALGLTPEHTPDLIALLEDHELRSMFPPDDAPDDIDLPEWYAQIHAWRALAELKAKDAIPPLLGILPQIDYDEDDWLSSDAPSVFGMIGPAAIDPLTQYLVNEKHPMYARSAASSSLAEIGNRHPEERHRCVQGIVAVLEKYKTNDDGFNGFLIGDLIDIKAVEQIDLIKKAYEADTVDEMVNGDVEDVQIEMGLLEKRLTPERPRWIPQFMSELQPKGLFESPSKSSGAKKKEKKKRKQEKKSRKKNRKHK